MKEVHESEVEVISTHPVQVRHRGFTYTAWRSTIFVSQSEFEGRFPCFETTFEKALMPGLCKRLTFISVPREYVDPRY